MGWTYRANAFEIPFIATYAPPSWVSIGISSRVLGFVREAGVEQEKVDGVEREWKDCPSQSRSQPQPSFRIRQQLCHARESPCPRLRASSKSLDHFIPSTALFSSSPHPCRRPTLQPASPERCRSNNHPTRSSVICFLRPPRKRLTHSSISHFQAHKRLHRPPKERWQTLRGAADKLPIPLDLAQPR